MTDIAKVAIVGGGFVGSGIAESVARAGTAVQIVEPTHDGLERARGALDRSVGRGVKAGKLDAESAAQLIERVTFTTALGGLAACDLVIEAVNEDEDLKRRLFGQMSDVVRADAIIASNTSSIPIAHLAAAAARPERVVGLHFFSPVPVMKLVEVVVALDTSDATVGRARAFAEAIGDAWTPAAQTFVRAGICSGAPPRNVTVTDSQSMPTTVVSTVLVTPKLHLVRRLAYGAFRRTSPARCGSATTRGGGARLSA